MELKTYFFSLDVPVSNPFSELWSPVLQQVGFSKLLALSVPKPALRLGRCDDMDRVEVYLQPLAGFRCDLVLRAPGTTVVFQPHSARTRKIGISCGKGKTEGNLETPSSGVRRVSFTHSVPSHYRFPNL